MASKDKRPQPLGRRTFLINSGTLLTLGAAAIPTLQVLTGCTSINEIQVREERGRIRVPLSAFGNTDNVAPVVLALVNGYKHPVAIIMSNNNSVHALYAMCTHKHCPLDVDSTGFSCNCHGSTFDLTGSVTNGPAKDPLTILPVTKDGEFLVVDLTPAGQQS